MNMKITKCLIVLLMTTIPCLSFVLKCNFKEDIVWRGYGCEIKEWKVTNHNAKISVVHGMHMEIYSNDDVESIRIENLPEMKYFTNDIFVKFRNLHNLVIHSTSLQQLLLGDFALADRLSNAFITHNHITALEDYCFHGAQRLKMLNLRSNKISSIAEHAFSGLRTLKYLTLTANEIEMLHASTFNEQMYLEQLSLSFNKLRHIDERLLSKNRNLKVLFLDNNHLKVINGNMFQHNQHLREIYMDNNHIEHISNARHFLVNLKDLEVVILTNNTCVNIQIFIMHKFYPPYERIFEHCDEK